MVAMLCPTLSVLGQSTIAVRNNTRNNLSFTATQYGTTTLPGSAWALEANAMEWWAVDSVVFSAQRLGTTISDGDTIYYDLKVTSVTDTLLLKLRLLGTPSGNTLAYGVGGQGLTETWYADTNFHQVNATMGGREVIVKFKTYNSDDAQSQDLLFAIHDSPIYEIDPADTANPHVLNVMTFNAQMLPLGIAGLKQANIRAELIPLDISPNQDVVVFQELMDRTARMDYLVPGMVAAGFPYYTTVLNDTDVYITNGGVIFFSRWPIERTEDWKYTACGPSSEDCLAIKGVQYIKINKLGTKYHLFGTHMDAGSQQADIDAKQVQMGEIRRFIAAQNIPQYEAVILGGDFNISPFSSSNLYANMLDTLNPALPNYTGFYSSTENAYVGKIIDHLWNFKDYLVPLEAENYIVTFRSIDDRMWEMSWLGDHRPVLGRFVYPDLTLDRERGAVCPGDSLFLAVNTSLPTAYTWKKDGLPYANTTNQVLYYPATVGDGGSYNCNITYSATVGGTADSLNRFFHLNGEETINVDLNISFGNITVDSVLCLLGTSDVPLLKVKLYPNPAYGTLMIEVPQNAGNALITLTDLQGKIMLTQNIVNTTTNVDISHLPTGLYWATISTPQGRATSKIAIVN